MNPLLKLKSMKWLLLLSGMLVTILGIIFIFMPLSNLIMFALIIGIGILISGFSEIVTFFNEEKGNRSGLMLASGIISVLFGSWTLFGGGVDSVASILPYIFAIWVVVTSVTRIVNSISLKTENNSLWSWIMAFGIIGMVIGLLLMFTPLLSAIIISLSLALMFISHGIGNIIIFFRIRNVEEYLQNVQIF